MNGYYVRISENFEFESKSSPWRFDCQTFSFLLYLAFLIKGMNCIMITAINHITLAVRDIPTAFEFYDKVLNFKPLVKWDKGAYFLVGEPSGLEAGAGLWFCLNLDTNRIPNPCYTHYAFSVSKHQFEKMSKNIIASGAKIFKENTSPGDSLYFLDPDGHKLELHTGNVESRLSFKKANIGNWQNVTWFA